jgi:hypothetical protein
VLTFVLLVVIGGGVGLLVVSSAESYKPATDGGSGLRAAPSGVEDDDPESPDDLDHDGLDEESDDGPLVEPVVDPALVAAMAGRPPVRRRVRDPRSVPSAHVAVEGPYQLVARAPIWRRLLSVVGIAVIAVALGVAIAAILGAIVGAAAEILGNTIG